VFIFTTISAIIFILCCVFVLYFRSADSVGKTYSFAIFGLCCWLERIANVYGLCVGLFINII